MSYSRRYARGVASSSNSSSGNKSTSDKNQQIIKTLLNDPANKHCADCKTAAHPRWASWSLGVFLCIRCSGIHRGMGTHISKVRSIDLDSWDDKHLENMIKWGNKRANIYWEHKLPANYVPDDSKIQNFIRTKYDMKRWVIPGPMPDPSTLNEDEDGEDSVPLAYVKKDAEQKQAQTAEKKQPKMQTNLVPDLLGDSVAPMAKSQPTTQVSNASTSLSSPNAPNPPLAASKPQPPAPTATSKQQPADSLLGLDFGSSNSSSSPAAPQQQQKPAAATSNSSSASSGVSRPDLKKSILSLYANASRPPQPQVQQVQPVQQQQIPQSPPHQQTSSFSAFDSLTGATSNLSLGSGMNSMNSGGNAANSFFSAPQTTSNTTTSPKPNDAFASLSFSSNSKPENTTNTTFSTSSELKMSHNQRPSASGSGFDSNWAGNSNSNSNNNNNNNNTNDLFDSLVSNNNTSSSTASNWTTTPSAQSIPSQKTNLGADDNEWASFSSGPSAKPPVPPGMEDDLFGNVWK